MKKAIWKKIGSILLAAALAAGVLAGCGDAGDLDATVMTVNGDEVSNAEYRYYFNSLKANVDAGDDSYWQENEDQIVALKTAAANYILQTFAVRELAEQEGITLTEGDQEALDNTMESMKTQYGDADALAQALEENNLTTEVFRKNLEDNLLNQKLFDHLYGDQIMEQVSDDTWFCAKHILIQYDDPDAETHEEELEAARNLLERARNGEDFDQLIADYGEDPGMTEQPDGYYFDLNGNTPDGGSLVEEFYKGAQALEINGISEPMATDYGYHIIKRVPLDMDYIEQNRTSFATAEMDGEYAGLLNDQMQQLEIDYANIYSKITYDTYQ